MKNNRQPSSDVLLLRKRVAEEIAPAIRWVTPESGSTTCPAGHPCKVYIDDNPTPTFCCFHESCQQQLAEWNAELRSRCPSGGRIGKSKERREQEKQDRRLWEVEAQTRRYILPTLLRQPEVDLEALTTSSPCPLPQDLRNDWRLLLSGLFEPDDVIWCGELHETGKEEYSRNFHLVKTWVKKTQHPGSQTCPAVFKSISTHSCKRRLKSAAGSCV